MTFPSYYQGLKRNGSTEVILLSIGCADDDFCQMADIPNVTTSMFFPCTLYPVAHICDDAMTNILDNCSIVLPQKPQLLYQKKGKRGTCFCRICFVSLVGTKLGFDFLKRIEQNTENWCSTQVIDK